MAIKGGKWEMSDEDFERQYAEATQAGKAETARGMFAIAARYDKTARRIVVELANGLSLLVPVRLIKGLQTATGKELAEIEILGAGSGLHWPQLSVDIGTARLLAGELETKPAMTSPGSNSTAAVKRAGVLVQRQAKAPRKNSIVTRERKRAA